MFSQFLECTECSYVARRLKFARYANDMASKYFKMSKRFTFRLKSYLECTECSYVARRLVLRCFEMAFVEKGTVDKHNIID